jgi:hypothetical protein
MFESSADPERLRRALPFEADNPAPFVFGKLQIKKFPKYGLQLPMTANRRRDGPSTKTVVACGPTGRSAVRRSLPRQRLMLPGMNDDCLAAFENPSNSLAFLIFLEPAADFVCLRV